MSEKSRLIMFAMCILGFLGFLTIPIYFASKEDSISPEQKKMKLYENCVMQHIANNNTEKIINCEQIKK